MSAPKRNPIPQKRLPPETRLALLSASYEQLRKRYEQQRRLLWCAVHAAGGRLEIHPDVYNATMGAPQTDTLVKIEPDAERNKVVLVFCDENGERLPESDKKLIIEA